MGVSGLIVQLLNGLAGASALFLVAAGLSLIFGVTRIVNFAHGSLYMLGAYIAYSAIGRFGASVPGYWLAVLAAALAVGAIGALIEMLLLRRIYHAPELLQLIATFGVVLIIEDATLALWGPEDLLGPRASGFKGAIEIAGRVLPQYDALLIGIGPAILLALWWLLKRTRWGMLVRAATENRVMVQALGVNEVWLFTSVFFLGAMLAGLAGALQLPRESANLAMDLSVIAEAFVVTVVGGLGSIPGAFVAALLIRLVKAICIGLGQVELGGVVIAFPKLTLVAEFVVLAVVLAPAAALVGALIFGWFCVRLSGIYLAMLTLAFAQIVWSVAFQWDSVTGGSNGLIGVWPPAWLGGKQAYFHFTLCVIAAALIAIAWLAHTPFGYALRAGRDSRLRAEA